MSNKRIKELKNLTQDELKSKIREAQSSMFQLKMKLKTAQLEDTASLWRQRKDVARMKMLVGKQEKV